VMTSPEGKSVEPGLAPVWTSRQWLACAALLWFGCSAAYFLTAPGRIDIIDGGIRYSVTASLIERGSPEVRERSYRPVKGRGGKPYAFYPLGTSLTAVPLVLLGAWLGHGSLESKQFAFSMTSVPFAAAVVALVFLIYGRLRYSLSQSLTWSLAVAFCTMLWPYAGSTFDVTLQAFWLTLGVWSAVEALWATSYGWALLSGASFAMLINIQEIYVMLAPCVAAAFPLTRRSVLAKLRHPVVPVIGLGVLIGVMLVCAYNALRFGNPLDTGRTTVPHPLFGVPLVGLYGLVVSPAKSIILYCPPIVLALIGLRRMMAFEHCRFAPVFGCLVLHLTLVSSLRFWAGEWAWGPRYLVASLPLACIGLPYSWPGGTRRNLKLLVCGLGFAVQVLAISVDHHRFYYDRSLSSFFWTNESVMYKQSPLFSRPFELIEVIEGRDLAGVRALTPAIRPMSMTSSTFGPPPEDVGRMPEWMREYLVFVVPRPWALWSRYLPDELKPGPTGMMTMIGGVVAAVSFLGLLGIVHAEKRRIVSRGAAEIRTDG
jgi:hypothetical protein